MLLESKLPGLLAIVGQLRFTVIVSDEVLAGIWNGIETWPLPVVPTVLPRTLPVLVLGATSMLQPVPPENDQSKLSVAASAALDEVTVTTREAFGAAHEPPVASR